MIQPIKYSEDKREEILNRAISDTSAVEENVKSIIADVIKKGDKAVSDYTEKFDGVKLDSFLVGEEEIAQAESKVAEEYKQILRRSADNIAKFHKAQLRQGFEIKENGCVIGQKVTPLDTVGIYVPGGTAAYPSTVLMNAIPAKIAGVRKVVMVTPPQKTGIKPEVLVAAKISGVDEIYTVGGAQAVAALAYGTKSIPKVDKITGPGNIFVATAKKLVYGVCGIDMIAGPSEILVIADDGANAEYVAADMLSQAEHDKLATAVLITDSEKLANAVSVALDRRVKALDRREIAQASLDKNCKIIIAESLAQAAEISDSLAPEHLELCVRQPFELLNLIKNAGSVFLGNNTPEAVGDYYAGANHTLPTSGTAKFASPLGVEDFIKTTQYVYYTDEKLKESADDIVAFARSEGLTAHAQSVSVRMEK
ncbi:MAG: histidinol dehydrogenase [Candidatus Coproplasma sp.]